MLIDTKKHCLVFYLLFLCSFSAFAQDNSLKTQLNTLKTRGNLTEWLYVQIDYANADTGRQAFLTQTRKQAWRQPKTIDEQVAWLTLLTTVGYNQLQAGDILQSISSYEDAYSFYRKNKVSQFDFAEYIVKPLGNNYTRLGDYERAIFLQQSTINSLNKVNDADKIAALYSNIAITYYNIERYDAAEKSVASGLAMVHDTRVKFNLNNTLADILLQKKDFEKARMLLNNNIATCRTVNEQTAYGLTGSHTTLGNIYLQTNKLAAAQHEFAVAVDLLDSYYPAGRQRERAYLTAQLGKISRLQGQAQKALAQFNSALQILRINTLQNQTPVSKIYGENKLVDIFHEKALTYLQLKQPVLALQNMRYALLATDKMRKEFADNKTKERLQQEGKALAEETIELAYNLYLQSGNKQYLKLILEVSEQTKARTLADDIQKTYHDMAAGKQDTALRRKLDMERAISYNERLAMTEGNPAMYQKKIAALKFELALLNKKYRAASTGTVASADELLKRLPASAHVVAFFWGERALYVIELKNRAVVMVNRIDNAVALRKQVSGFLDTFYRNGPNGMINAPKAFYQQSNAIYQNLFKGIALNKNAKLCIVPDDVLGYLSFDGLITNNKFEPAPSLWPYLIRQLTISYAFSLNTFVTTSNPTKCKESFSGLFMTHDSANDKAIIAVKQEAEAVAKLVKGRYVFDEDVNPASFFKAFDNSAALHISTHAYLYGPNREPALDFGKQQLFLFELLARPQKPGLVVLSACRTGDGSLAQGEGIISLSRGFIAIGTAATVSGLWNVNDDAVSHITADMYAGLTNGQSTATALHNAKLAWLNNAQTTDALYMPYYWDTLVLTGADEIIDLPQAISWLSLQIAIAVIVLALGGVVVFKRLRKTEK